MSQSTHEYTSPEYTPPTPVNDREVTKPTRDLKAEATNLAEHPELRNEVFIMLENLDNTKFMQVAREAWNKVPAVFQNVVLRLPSILPHIKLLKGFVRVGLLKPKDSNLSIEDISKTERVMEKIALWLAKKLVPEMRAFEKTVDPILQKLGFKGGLKEYIEFQDKLQEDFCTSMRTRLDVARLQHNVSVANDTHGNSNNDEIIGQNRMVA